MFNKEKKVKVKKPFYKKIWVWVVAIILVIMFNSGGEETPTTEEASKEVSTEPKEKEAPKEEANGKLNQPYKVGDVTFTVTGISNATNVGGEWGVDAQGKFLILDVIVKNEGKEALTVDSSFFTLSSGGATYEADGSADIYANESGKSFFLQEINPNLQLKGKVVFDVTEEVINDAEKALNVQTGFFGTETGLIKLK